jgi:hypothetical protein
MIILVFIQIAYISMDLVASETQNEKYGIVGGGFMILFGVLLFIDILYTIFVRKFKHKNMAFEFVEAVIYMGLGIGVTVSRTKHLHIE